MACDATARLYDVDEDTVVFKKHDKTESYDQGTIEFRARKGRLIDLDKLHESVWATRLSGGTRSGLVSLQVSAIGRVVNANGRTMLRVADSDGEFVLTTHPGEDGAAVLGRLQVSAEADTRQIKVTGQIADYRGRWPNLLKKKPQNPRRLLVTSFDVLEAE